MEEYMGWFFPVVVILAGWSRLALPLRLPMLELVTGLASRVVQGDLPDEIASFDVYAPEKVAMVEDVLRLGAGWQNAYQRLRLVSACAGTCAMTFGIAALFSRSAPTASPLPAVIGLLGLMGFLVGVLVEARMKRNLQAQLSEDIGGLVERWRQRLSGESTSA